MKFADFGDGDRIALPAATVSVQARILQMATAHRALIDALAEAATLISSNPEAAADAYLRVNKSNIDRALLPTRIPCRAA